ncbi:MAG: DUF6445 family protein [Rhodospirillales bacterium]
MFPYKPEEVFTLNKNLEPNVFLLGDSGNAVVTIDNFYEHPETIREIILNTPYPIWKHNERSRNFIDYYDCRQFLSLPMQKPAQIVQQIARDIFGVVIPHIDIEFITNLFKLAADQPPGSQPHPHDDGLRFASLITFNTDEECSGGTAFYRRKNPPYDHMPPTKAAYDEAEKRVYTPDMEWEDGTHYFCTTYRDHWDVIDVVPAKFNRLLIYPGIYFHGAWHEQNAFKDYYRVNQVMFFDNVTYPE